MLSLLLHAGVKIATIAGKINNQRVFFSAMFAIFIPPEPNVKAFYGCIYIFKDDYVI